MREKAWPSQAREASKSQAKPGKARKARQASLVVGGGLRRFGFWRPEGFTPPLRMGLPVDPGQADLNPSGAPFSAQEPFRSDPKIHYFFNRFLNPFWQHFGSQNGSKNHRKSIKNHSKTKSGLKTALFRKIAPRLGETLILEGPGSPKPSQNHPKTLQKPTKNPTKISMDFSIDFLMILAPFWSPFGLPLGSKIS